MSTPSEKKKARILVMDDEEPIRRILTLMLGKLGYDAEAAAEGGEAVARYQAAQAAGNPFAAVILDLTVRRGMGGIETLERLRAVDPTVRAIVTTGHSAGSAEAARAEDGFCTALPKPFHLRDVDTALQQALA
jgi:CheY-like chemotaxis protein